MVILPIPAISLRGGYKGSTSSSRDVRDFSSGFDFCIVIPINAESAFLAKDSIFENFYNFSLLLSIDIDNYRFFGVGLRKVRVALRSGYREIRRLL